MKLLENELELKSRDEQVKISMKDLGIIDDDDKSEHRFISLDNLDISSSFNKLIPFISTFKLVQLYEDKNLRHYILSSIIPLEDFQRKISKQTTDIHQRDLLLLELLRWFKEDFFTWFNQPNCDRCQISMKFIEYTQPTREEREVGHAQRVEFYR